MYDCNGMGDELWCEYFYRNGKEKVIIRTVRYCERCEENNGKNLYDCRGMEDTLFCDYFYMDGKEIDLK